MKEAKIISVGTHQDDRGALLLADGIMVGPIDGIKKLIAEYELDKVCREVARLAGAR